MESLAPVHNFSIESSIKYYAPLSIAIAKEDPGGSVIEEDDLRAFVNSADWNLRKPNSDGSVRMEPVTDMTAICSDEHDDGPCVALHALCAQSRTSPDADPYHQFVPAPC